MLHSRPAAMYVRIDSALKRRRQSPLGRELDMSFAGVRDGRRPWSAATGVLAFRANGLILGGRRLRWRAAAPALTARRGIARLFVVTVLGMTLLGIVAVGIAQASIPPGTNGK